MPRIAKADINKALSLAAKTIIAAGGADGRTSRSELKAALPALPDTQRKLVDVFFKFIDHRDFRRGAQVTKADVDKAVTYAKKTMVAQYDLNGNGLSAAEIKKMSLTGKLAVDLAKTLKTVAVDEGPVAPPRLDEGYSEPAEILAAGQVPRDWKPGANIASGTVKYSNGAFVGLDTTVRLTKEQREVATTALAHLWERSLKYRMVGTTEPFQLGDRAEGTLKVGTFKRSDDKKTYLVADWRDIDDGSFTLYFERLSSGKLRLAIEQFNN
jgi:hypothetical protein